MGSRSVLFGLVYSKIEWACFKYLAANKEQDATCMDLCLFLSSSELVIENKSNSS
jgi:hypothetical protein